MIKESTGKISYNCQGGLYLTIIVVVVVFLACFLTLQT